MTDGTNTDLYDYDAWGSKVTSGSSFHNTYIYTGREAAENDLYYYRARYYLPEVGRFVSADPLGFGAGMKLYAYVDNAPTMAIDPSGKKKCCPDDQCPSGIWSLYSIAGSVFDAGAGEYDLSGTYVCMGVTEDNKAYVESLDINIFCNVVSGAHATASLFEVYEASINGACNKSELGKPAMGLGTVSSIHFAVGGTWGSAVFNRHDLHLRFHGLGLGFSAGKGTIRCYMNRVSL